MPAPGSPEAFLLKIHGGSELPISAENLARAIEQVTDPVTRELLRLRLIEISTQGAFLGSIIRGISGHSQTHHP